MTKPGKIHSGSLGTKPEARSEPGTLLRTAFEVRERAYAAWCREPDAPSVNDGSVVILLPDAPP